VVVVVHAAHGFAHAGHVFAPYCIAAGIGGLVGASELFARYEDSPRRLLRKLAFWLYVAVNLLASGGALYVMRELGWTIHGASGKGPDALLAIAAGLSGVLLLRSSLAVVPSPGGHPIGAGPLGLVEAVLDAIDRVIDRDQAEERARMAAKLAPLVSYELAHVVLPQTCMELMERPPTRAVSRLIEHVDGLDVLEDVPDAARAVTLVITLMSFAGPKVVEAAIDSLRPTIAPPKPDPSAPLKPDPPALLSPGSPGLAEPEGI
jgi:hypothetical protein